MSFTDGSDAFVTRAATSMHFAADAPPQGALLSQPQHTHTGGDSPAICITAEKRAGSHTTAATVDLASPPPRPPQRSESSADGAVSDASPAAHKQQLSLEPALHHSGCTDACRSEDPVAPHRETRTTRGPFTSLESSDSTTATALFSTTALLNATTMPLAPSEESQASTSVFSPSVHRPTVAGDRDALDGGGGSRRTGSEGDAARSRCGKVEDVGPRDPSDGPSAFTHAAHQLAGHGVDVVDGAHVDGAESDDEDEDGLFQETVLLMNNTLHSLGRTRRTPSKPAQTPLLRGDSSPVPKIPSSLEATPTKPARDAACDRQVSSDTIDGARPTTAAAAAAFEMNASATTASTQAYQTAPASPATTYSMRTATAGPAASPLLHPQLPLAVGQHALPPSALQESAKSEYLFIDNHDGTAYLADASLQLDGSYALGQTILLARRDAASPVGVSGRARRTAGGGGGDGGSCGAQSPIVVPQALEEMPVQRDRPAHRPVRGAALPAAAAPAAAAPSVPSFSCSATPTSPVPSAFANTAAAGSPLAPSVARVVVRRSPAPARDAASASRIGSDFLPPTFNGSFRFDQTLLVPLGDTLRSSGGGDGSSGFAASASPCLAERSTRLVGRMQRDASVASYRSAAPGRWETAASPLVVVPTSPAASFAVYAHTRSHAPSLASSVSRASPVPHAPSVGRQLAAQQARAARDTRPSRPEQDVIYLVPAGAATTTMTPEDITGQGWIPVHVVDVPPRGAAAPAAAAAAAAAGGDGRRGGGRTVSPVPTDPQTAAYAPRRRAAENGGVGERDADGDDNDDDEDDEVAVREQSLSRLSPAWSDAAAAAAGGGGGGFAARNDSFSLASTLSASTLDCINRRLSYSVSGWASARQRFGGSVSLAEGLPPATPLSFGVPSDAATGSVAAGEEEEGPGQRRVQQQPLTIRVSSDYALRDGGDGNNGSSSNSRGRQGSDGGGGAYPGGSPIPQPPGKSETPQREGSPSRCTTDAGSLVAALASAAVPAGDQQQQQQLHEEGQGEVDGHGVNSLLTSMSFQRPSTMTTMTSEEGPGGYSMSLPLTSSASQSIGLQGQGGRVSYGYGTTNPTTARTSNAGSLNGHHPFQLQHQQHQALRAPHPRRVSGATALSQGASLLSFQTLGDQSDPPTSAEGESAQQSQQQQSRSTLSAAGAFGATSFRTTYCNNRTTPSSVTAASLNPSSGGPMAGVGAAGLPLSRGHLGASQGPRGANRTAATTHAAPKKKSYAQQYAAAAERRRPNRGGGGGGAAAIYANASSLSVDSGAARSGGVSRNAPFYHPYANAAPQHQPMHNHPRRAAAAVGARRAGGGCGGGRLVPDTSVFLPWAPLTITPEGSLNLGCFGGGDLTGTAAGGGYVNPRMNLIPYTSSAETSMLTTTTTTQTTTTTTNMSGTEGVLKAQETAQQVAANGAAQANPGVAPEALRSLVAAMSHATTDGRRDALLSEGDAVNKEAFLASFLRHAASQAATSVGDGSLSAGSQRTTTTTNTTATTTTTTTTPESMMAGKSLAMSRATHLTGEMSTQERSGWVEYQALEATVNQFQASVSAIAAQEPEPRAPAVAPVAVADKENATALRASVGAVRSSGLREGSTANVVCRAGKARSPAALNVADAAAEPHVRD